MSRSVLVRLVLAAVVVVSLAGIFGTMSVPSFDASAERGSRPCVSDADCQGSQICCPISNTCTQAKGCRKDPL